MNNNKPNPTAAKETDNIYFIAILGFLVGAFIAIFFIFNIVLKDDEKRASQYDTKVQAAADSMGYEERAAAVAGWTKDIINNVEANSDRTKFVELAEFFSEDGRIDVSEYVFLYKGYDQIKGYKHTGDIDQQVSAFLQNEGIEGKSTIVIDDVAS